MTLCPTFAATAASPASDTQPVGVAAVDITPDYPVRLSGFGFRRTESEGVTQRIWAKAIAFGGDDGARPGGDRHRRQPRRARLHDAATSPSAWRRRPSSTRRASPSRSRTRTPPPMLSGVLPDAVRPADPARAPGRTSTATRASSPTTSRRPPSPRSPTCKPAKLEFGIGTGDLAMNRRTQGRAGRSRPAGAGRARRPTASSAAIYLSYACHCVTLSHNKISGDWAGYVAGDAPEEPPRRDRADVDRLRRRPEPEIRRHRRQGRRRRRAGPADRRRGRPAAQAAALSPIDRPVATKADRDRADVRHPAHARAVAEDGRSQPGRTSATTPACSSRSSTAASSSRRSSPTRSRPGRSATSWRWSSSPARSSSTTRCASSASSTAAGCGSTPTPTTSPATSPPSAS